MEMSFKKFYSQPDLKKSLVQFPFLSHICDTVIIEQMTWLGDEKARIAFAKEPDIFVYSKNEILWDAMKELHRLLRDQNLLNEVFYKSEKHLSYNNLQDKNAYEIWCIDVDLNNNPYVTRVPSGDILAKSKVINRIIEVKIRKEMFELNGSSFYIIEVRNSEYIETSIADAKGQLVNLNLENIPKEIFNKYEGKWGQQTWPYDFEPFVYISNNPDELGDIFYVQSELNELLAVRVQKYFEIFFAGTKAIIDEEGNQNFEKEADNNNVFSQAIAAASSPVIKRNSPLFPNGSFNPGFVYGQPTVDPYEKLEKSIRNRMLQKVGAATDVDAKGTVQQTQSELVMMQGNQYRAMQWKNNDRQQKIQELFVKIALILMQNNNKSFVDFTKIRVILSQDEVLSENQMLENLKMAQDDGLTSKIIAIARYNKLNVIEAYDMMQVDNIGPKNNNEEKSTSNMGQSASNGDDNG